MQPTDGDDDAREKGVSIWFVRSQCRVSICLIIHTHTHTHTHTDGDGYGGGGGEVSGLRVYV